jgi:5-methylcytosine-specific restriction endonuclease McrA
MDHTVPVIEGGGEAGLDNLRTLCQPCHKSVTADLAKRRAEQRRQEKLVQTGQQVMPLEAS